MKEEKQITLSGAFKEAVKSRVFLVLTVILVVQLVAFLIIVLSIGKVGSVQVPIRYDGYSYTNIFRDNGSYLLNFAFYGIVLFCANILVSMKLYIKKGRSMALGVLWLTVAVFFISTVILLVLLSTGSVL